ncbi:MAG: AAA family ATPase, partial [Nannocystaceae bacterium]|nr:AAA family ATPase [Nannocystaceae bacterium]
PPEPGAPPIAVKAVLGMSPDGLVRFKREFRALADVRHRNVIQLHELTFQGNRLFFSMELIRGESFVEYLCGPARDGARTIHDPAKDFDRVRDAMRQLAEGVQVIHDAGFLHRDLKPSNVMVESGGRIVILDFGLVRDIDSSLGVGVTADGAVLGTPLFMSPEQAAGEPIGRSSDWYTVGEMLFQALTGRPPYGGMGLLALLAAKKDAAPPKPTELNPHVPEDLEALCVDLLSRDPEARPKGPRVLQRLGSDVTLTPVEDNLGDLFLGRDDEFSKLQVAYEATRAGRPVVVMVEGVSGIGKSALVQRFLSRATREGAVVLGGKCSERESIPYKALDSAIDTLTAVLCAMETADEVKAVLPRNVSAVTRLFPVLLSVPAIALAPFPQQVEMMPHEARRRGIEALRELLGRIADARPLILYIDDLQWSDLDSLVVLETLLRDVDAPPIMLVCSFREGSPEEIPILGQFIADLHAVEPALDVRALRVGPMSIEDATGLALRLLGPGQGQLQTLAETVARESEGSPFFVAQLVRHAMRRELVADHDSATDVSLDDVIRARLQMLSPTARRLLAVIAVSGGKLLLGVAMHVATDGGLNSSSLIVLAEVRGESMVRTNGQSEDDAIEINHDRIRETVLRDLADDERADLHLAIGHALAVTEHADAADLSHHFREAGETQLAVLHTVRAAGEAAEALAFDRAAELYEAALALGVPAEQRAELQERLGRALASAGRQYEAAKVLLEAVEDLPVEARPALLQAAAELLLTSGHSTEGREVLRRVLAEFSMRLPKTRGRALASLLANRAALAVRGLDATIAPPEDLDAITTGKLDALWTAARGLVYTDGLVAADFHARHLRLALKSGDGIRISRALGFEAHLLASLKAEAGRSRCFELVEQASILAEERDSEYARGMVSQSRGHVHMMFGDWAQCRTNLDEAVETFRERCSGAAQEIGYCEIHAALSEQLMGHIRALAPRAQKLLRDSTRRAHPYSQGYARGMLGHVIYLADGRVEEAREQLELYRAELPVGFQAHVLNLVDTMSALLRYEGKVEDAWVLQSERRKEIESFDMMRAPFPKGAHLWTLTQNALAMARRSADPSQLLAAAERSTRALTKLELRHAQGFGHLGGALVCRARGDQDGVVLKSRLALERFEAGGMELYAALTQLLIAGAVGGSEAEVLRSSAAAYTEREKIQAHEKLFEMLAPGSAESV